jgi:hypothetical protein
LYLTNLSLGQSTNIGTLNKTGSGYLSIQNCNLGIASGNTLTNVNITGSGTVVFNNTQLAAVTVNNASASVSIVNNSNTLSVTLTTGVLNVFDSYMYTLGNSGFYAVNATGGVLQIRNSILVNPNQTPARVNLASPTVFAYDDIYFDRANSTLGISANAEVDFQSIRLSGALSVTGNITGGNILTGGNLSVTGNIIGNGALLTNVVQALVKPNNLLYVAKNGNDTSGTGSINAPYLTIQAAIYAAAGDTATTIILAPGSYVENLTIANVENSLNITGSGLAESAINGNIAISGTSNNIEFDNFRISTGRVTHSATGYWSVLNLRFSANTGITKTSSSTIKIFNTDLGAAGTGNILLQGGKTNIYNSQIFNVQVSGATTEVNFLQCDTVILPTVTAGNVNFIDTNIVSSGTGNSLTATGGNVTLKNCLSITPTRVLAPINFGASSRFSYGDSAFDYANTTFAGTAIIQQSQSQSINVRGGNILTTGQISATGNITTANSFEIGRAHV